MSMGNRGAGSEHTPAYQISGIPFVTSSLITLGQIKHIHFPTVTRNIIVKNESAGLLAVAFTENGLKPVNSNFIRLALSESFDDSLRIKDIFLSGSSGASLSFTVIAGLTTIHDSMFPTLTGSIDGMQGIG
jgi:hypothetical protein